MMHNHPSTESHAHDRASLPQTVEQLQRAWNSHDLSLLADCLAADYESVHPLHPERNFSGRVAALASWGAVFDAIPDLHAELLNYSVTDDEIWTEWYWHGTHLTGSAFNAGGVMVFGLSAGRIAWARVYTEIATPVGPDWEAVLEEVLAQANES